MSIPPENPKLIEARTELLDLVDRHLGKRIDDIVKAIGDEELRSPLRDAFGQYFVVAASIKAAKDPDEFEAEIDKAGDLLESRIQAAVRTISAEAQKHESEIASHEAELSELHEELLKSKASFDAADGDSIPLDVKALLEKGQEWQETALRAMSAGADVVNHLARMRHLLTAIARKHLEKGYRKFKRWKRIRRWKQAFFRILLAVIIFGVGYSVITSSAGKVFLELKWWLYVLFAIFTVVLKEYVISPWIKRKRLSQQRRDLLRTFTDFFAADLNYVLSSYYQNP